MNKEKCHLSQQLVTDGLEERMVMAVKTLDMTGDPSFYGKCIV